MAVIASRRAVVPGAEVAVPAVAATAWFARDTAGFAEAGTALRRPLGVAATGHHGGDHRCQPLEVGRTVAPHDVVLNRCQSHLPIVGAMVRGRMIAGDAGTTHRASSAAQPTID